MIPDVHLCGLPSRADYNTGTLARCTTRERVYETSTHRQQPGEDQDRARHDLAPVTRDLRAVERTGVRVVAPFDDG